MTHNWLNAQNVDAAYDQVAQRCLEALACGRRPMVVVPSIDDVVIAKKELSTRGASFGVGVEHFSGWVSDLWELFGDGRSLVSGVERTVRCARLLQDSEELMATGGMVRLFADVVREALPQALESTGEGLSANERTLIELARAYDDSLECDHLVEECIAVRLLGGRAWDTYDVYAIGFEPDRLIPAQTHSFAQAAAVLMHDERVKPRCGSRPRSSELTRVLECLYQPDHANPVVAQGAVRFAFPSGKGAELRIIVDHVHALAQSHPGQRIAVVSMQPYRMFRNLAREASLEQVELRYSGVESFAYTDAGRVLFQLADAVGLWKEAPADVRAAADLAFNPLLGRKVNSAFTMARRWRGDRLITSEKLASSMTDALLKGMKPAVAAMRSGRIGDVLTELNRYIAARTHLPEAYRIEQLSALAQAREFVGEAERGGVGARLMLELLQGMSTGLSLCAESAQADAACVCVLSLEDAASMPPASFAALVMCEMNASERPVRSEESARRTLLAKLGVPDVADSLANVRRMYHDAVSSSYGSLVLERSLNAGDVEPQYPATLFEETVDCYRAFEEAGGNVQPESLVEPYAVTAGLIPFVTKLSEADFLFAATGSDEQAAGLLDDLPPSGVISPESASMIVLPRSIETAGLPGLDLSPSAIESYLECPHRWFAQRRLSLETPDEGFGGLERGTFVHSVLQLFYEQLKASGQARVTCANVAEAKQLLAQVFDDHLAEQPGKKPGRRYAPASRWEHEQLAALRRKLLAYVEAEPFFLPGFQPVYFELDYGQESMCPYAGHRLRGTIDRIDVDDRGNAVVIDYKTSLSKEYDAHDKEPDFTNGLPLPRKMQSLIYAEVVRDGIGFDVAGGLAIKNVVGALYVNPLTGEVRGAYDAHVLGSESIPGITASRASVPFGTIASFNELLDETERIVEQRLEGLLAGDIRPNPYGKDVCTYCPSMLCERRLA